MSSHPASPATARLLLMEELSRVIAARRQSGGGLKEDVERVQKSAAARQDVTSLVSRDPAQPPLPTGIVGISPDTRTPVERLRAEIRHEIAKPQGSPVFAAQRALDFLELMGAGDPSIGLPATIVGPLVNTKSFFRPSAIVSTKSIKPSKFMPGMATGEISPLRGAPRGAELLKGMPILPRGDPVTREFVVSDIFNLPPEVKARFSAAALAGEFGAANELPRVLYHVSPRAAEVRKGGILLPMTGRARGGMGGSRTASVSFTPSRIEARNIKETFERASEIAKIDAMPGIEAGREAYLNRMGAAREKIREWAKADAKLAESLLPPDVVIDEFYQNADFLFDRVARQVTQNQSAQIELAAFSGGDDPWSMFQRYLGLRNFSIAEAFGSRTDVFKRFKDIAISGGPQAFADMKDLGIIAVPTRSLPKEGVISIVDDVLEEIAVFGDVPLDKARFIF